MYSQKTPFCEFTFAPSVLCVLILTSVKWISFGRAPRCLSVGCHAKLHLADPVWQAGGSASKRSASFNIPVPLTVSEKRCAAPSEESSSSSAKMLLPRWKTWQQVSVGLQKGFWARIIWSSCTKKNNIISSWCFLVLHSNIFEIKRCDSLQISNQFSLITDRKHPGRLSHCDILKKQE